MEFTNYNTKYIEKNKIAITQDTSVICGVMITFTANESTRVTVGLAISESYNIDRDEIYWAEQDVSAGTHTISIPFAQEFNKGVRMVNLVIGASNGNIIIRNNAVHAYIKGQNLSLVGTSIS
ncbi:hypothetical protein ACQKII_07270 [Lysinibacillus sp. NPDC048646]|uniref:hypothetical protein n=1 Tax=Lysinibacillus sp. NPDC048646 TaxID=3390574 RepID=UPI003D034C6D